MCISQRLTFEVFTWALVLQITVPHWQSHLWLASCETLLWLPALEEGTLVYIWPPRLLSTSTSGRAGREGRAQVFAHKRNPWPWLRAPRHPCPQLGPLALLACYLLPQPLPTTPKPHPYLVKKPFGVAMPARPPGRTGCADEQRNIADRPLSLSPSLSLLVCLILSWVGLPRPAAADSDKDGALSSSESWRASQEECWSPRGLWRSWKEVEIRHKARGRAVTDVVKP